MSVQLETAVHAYNVAEAETVCGLTNPELTSSFDPDMITCTYCKSVLAHNVIQHTRAPIHYARPDGGGATVCNLNGVMLSLFWDDVTCTACKHAEPQERHMPTGPFTINELFKLKVQERWWSKPCHECGAIVSTRQLETHAEWHNKVADL